MNVTQHKALEVAILLHTHRESREKLIAIIQRAFDGHESLDVESLVERLQFIASFGSPEFRIDVNYYGLCLRLESQIA